MESSNEEFDLLVGEDDPLSGDKFKIEIEGEWVIDEDGDDAINLHIHTSPMTARGTAFILEAALEIVREALGDEDA